MFPKMLFDEFVHSFLLQPLIVAGKAMEYCALFDGHEYDFVIPRDEFRSLRKNVQTEVLTNAFGNAWIQIGDYQFYERLFGFSYFHLERVPLISKTIWLLILASCPF